MASRHLPLQLQKLPAEHLQKVRNHVQGLLAAGLQQIPDLNALDEMLAACVQSSGPRLCAGERVSIQGLNGAVELNGKAGLVVRLDDSSGRYVVELECDGSQKSLKAVNLTAIDSASSSVKRTTGGVTSDKVQAAKTERAKQKAVRDGEHGAARAPQSAGEFTVGDRVRVGGLNSALELNGQVAVVFGLDKASGRYVVRFENGAGQRKLQGKNLTAMGVATGPLAAEARLFSSMM
mmetsp:Transcript_12478/g.29284  ORF Transcript_12478/g.29284 Transcript_12478/m.29284 type:complete len:235 (-) Transcript_12478:132-836(-)